MHQADIVQVNQLIMTIIPCSLMFSSPSHICFSFYFLLSGVSPLAVDECDHVSPLIDCSLLRPSYKRGNAIDLLLSHGATLCAHSSSSLSSLSSSSGIGTSAKDSTPHTINTAQTCAFNIEDACRGVGLSNDVFLYIEAKRKMNHKLQARK